MYWNPRNPISVPSTDEQTTKFDLAMENKLSVARSFFFNLY